LKRLAKIPPVIAEQNYKPRRKTPRHKSEIKGTKLNTSRPSD
jgi:hypothetical protein